MAFGEGPSQMPAVIYSAANSAVMAGLARILTVFMTVVVLPAIAAILGIAWSWAQDQNEADARQNRLLDRLEWRMQIAEEINKKQEEHFKFSDKRIDKLERARLKEPGDL